MITKKRKKLEPLHRCEFCNFEFALEHTLVLHLCEKKRRFFERDERDFKTAFWAFNRFYEFAYRLKKQKSVDDFISSQLYSAFRKFGRYVLDINVINGNRFIDFLIHSGVPIDKWTSPLVYETYIREVNKTESPLCAIERNFEIMQQWAEETKEPWIDFFRKVNPTLATLWIKTGRISPWVLYTAPSAGELMERMTEEQIILIEGILDPEFWSAKLNQDTDEVENIREELERAGL